MVIDVILDRRDYETDGLADWYNINALRRIYDYAVDNGWDYLSRAIDGGTEADVKCALCRYIDKNEYNPRIKDYINSVEWLSVVDE